MLHKIAVITVVYQNYTVLNDLLLSLKKQTNKNFHFFITDLSDNKKQLNTNQLPLTVIPDKNLGYAHGINIALKEAMKQGYDKFCVINSDVVVANNFIQSIVYSLLKYPDSIISGKIYYVPGFEYHKDKYVENDLGKVIWYAGGLVDWNNVLIKHVGVDEVDKNQFNKVQETEFVTGCLMVFDKLIIDKVGFWDESYFLYYEDADFCERAKRREIKLCYDPSIVIWHKNAQSTEGSGSKLHQKYQDLNRLKFGLKYAPFKTRLHLIKNKFLNFLK